MITQQKEEPENLAEEKKKEEGLAEIADEDDEDGELAAERELKKIHAKFRDPEEVLELLNDLEDRYFFMTQHLQTLEDDYEKDKRMKEAREKELERIDKENQEILENRMALLQVPKTYYHFPSIIWIE